MNGNYSFFGAFLFALLLALMLGCKHDDVRNDEEIVSGVNYSMAQSVKLKPLKTKKDFADFCENNEIAVVKFTASWCGPCQALEPELEKMAGYFETQGVKIAEVDVDELKDLSNEMSISSIPHTFVYYNGRLYSDVVGFNPGAIASLIDSVCQKQESVSTNEKTSEADSLEDAWVEKSLEESEREDRAAKVVDLNETGDGSDKKIVDGE